MTVPGSNLADCITWVRRIIKSSSAQSISSETIVEYINRFYMYDVPSRIQLFELKRKYQFLTEPYKQIYNLNVNPFTDTDINAVISSYQGYMFIREPVYVDGVQIPLFSSNRQYYLASPSLVQNVTPVDAGGGPGPYAYTQPQVPILRGSIDDLGHLNPAVFITAQTASGQTLTIVDNANGGLIEVDSTFQIRTSVDSLSGNVDYQTGAFTGIIFSQNIPLGNKIRIQTIPQSAGRPASMQFFNNMFNLFPIPDKIYSIQCDAWITPAQFLGTEGAMPFFYMTEYLARGAARKILIDSKDRSQVEFYEPFFQEAEMLVLRRSVNQNSQERVPTIFSGPVVTTPSIYSQY